jgi:hypothetical protein
MSAICLFTYKRASLLYFFASRLGTPHSRLPIRSGQVSLQGPRFHAIPLSTYDGAAMLRETRA